MFQVTPDPPRHQKDERDSNHEIKPVEKGLEHRILVPLFAKLLTDVSEAETPRQRSRKSIDDELLQIHPRNSGGERYERANDRKQTAGENDGFPKAREPTIGQVQIMRRNQNVSSVLRDQRTTTVHPDPIGYEGADHATERAGHAD